MKPTKEEIKAFLISILPNLDTFNWRDGSDFDAWTRWNPLIGLIDVEGGEGQGEYYHRVYRFQMNGEDVYIKFVGQYDSWNGTEWYGEFEVVEPKQKVVTVYE